MKQLGQLCQVIGYDLDRYPLPMLVRDLFDGVALERLHERYPLPPTSTGDQDTPVHPLFYRRYQQQLQGVYQLLLREVILPHYDEDLCVQRVPTFRAHYPGALAVKEFHRDSDYHHQSGITNYWLPLTRAYGTNTIWVETGSGTEQYRPVELRPGQLLRFDAVQLKHGNQLNDTSATRVSFDFRVLPSSRYRETGLVSVSRGVSLRIGEYYQLLSKDGRFHEAMEDPR